ncbi:enoyl-hydratase isomerase family protein [Grosmannia clavigera kw1407]|uniref:Enoyl-hydratase isomerase family protein n=1 Tax=Grosmannia clavigera (strain kw1407 / UAMH 11150) TaxID=655863 RepID=F0XSM4_GROCL|nr:enoyl-hydratase isomerase family protein [Grosmannia clavigera kw1407]EFW99385.1 enoyl-hydratase isomerase family protein [Grosmannia clavigera kw1407]
MMPQLEMNPLWELEDARSETAVVRTQATRSCAREAAVALQLTVRALSATRRGESRCEAERQALFPCSSTGGWAVVYSFDDRATVSTARGCQTAFGSLGISRYNGLQPAPPPTIPPPLAIMTLEYISIGRPAEYVVHVELQRPDKINAFVPAMWAELGQVFRQLSRDPDVRAIVLSGAGDRGFTAGLDVFAAGEWMGEASSHPEPARRATNLRRFVHDFQACISAVEECEKPIICAIHGIAFGLAIDIACCADIRICTQDARFSVKEVDIGLAADIGTLARLPKIVASSSWVRDVCLTARVFPAAEAEAVGFVSRVLPSKAAVVAVALETATLIASKSPVAVQGTKELLQHARDHSVAENLRYTTVWNSAALQSNDVQAALVSGMQKTRPTFEKL